MQPILDNHCFISKENATLASTIFLPFAREKSSFFGPDVTSNFREGLKKKIESGVRKSSPLPPSVTRKSFRANHFALSPKVVIFVI